MFSTLILSAALLTAAPKNAEAPATEEPAAEEKAAKPEAGSELAKPAEEAPADDAAVKKEEKQTEPVAPKPVEPAASKPDVMPKVFYVVQHVAMGAGVAFVIVQAIVLAITGPVLWLLPANGNSEKFIPKEWRTAVMVGILAGVLPGLVILAIGGTAATVVSAVRNVGVMTGGN